MGDISIKPKKFIYKTKLKWTESKKGMLSSHGKPDIEVATPPEFKGHAGVWTPEDLFAASVNVCIMTTFLYYAQKENVELKSYQSEAEGVLEKTENGLIFTAIEIRPEVVISSKDVEKTKRILELSEKNCLISNSIRSNVLLKPTISGV